MSSVAFVVRDNIQTSGTFNFASENIGSAAANRKVIVAVSSIGSSTPNTASMTIGGVAATQDIWVTGSNDGNGNAFGCGLFSLDVPTGTSTAIVLTISGSSFDATIWVYAAYGVSGAAATNSAISNSGTSIAETLNLNTNSGSVVIAVGNSYSVSPVSVSWTGASQDDSFSLYGNEIRSVASFVATVPESPRAINVTATNLGTTPESSVGVSAVYNSAGSSASVTPSVGAVSVSGVAASSTPAANDVISPPSSHYREAA